MSKRLPWIRDGRARGLYMEFKPRSLRKEPDMGMHVVVSRNSGIGFRVWGPFKTRSHAHAWAERYAKGDWRLVPLEAPDPQAADLAGTPDQHEEE